MNNTDVNEPKEILLNHLWVKLSLCYHQLLLSFLIQNVKSRGAAKAAPSQSMLESDPATVKDEVREGFPSTSIFIRGQWDEAVNNPMRHRLAWPKICCLKPTTNCYLWFSYTHLKNSGISKNANLMIKLTLWNLHGCFKSPKS